MSLQLLLEDDRDPAFRIGVGRLFHHPGMVNENVLESCFQKMSGSILIATIDINVCSRTINFYPSISMNDCKTEIILCS